MVHKLLFFCSFFIVSQTSAFTDTVTPFESSSLQICCVIGAGLRYARAQGELGVHPRGCWLGLSKEEGLHHNRGETERMEDGPDRLIRSRCHVSPLYEVKEWMVGEGMETECSPLTQTHTQKSYLP